MGASCQGCGGDDGSDQVKTSRVIILSLNVRVSGLRDWTVTSSPMVVTTHPRKLLSRNSHQQSRTPAPSHPGPPAPSHPHPGPRRCPRPPPTILSQLSLRRKLVQPRGQDCQPRRAEPPEDSCQQGGASKGGVEQVTHSYHQMVASSR